MLPSRYAYGLLLLGVAIVPVSALIWPDTPDIPNLAISLTALLLLDSLVLGLVIRDGSLARSRRVQVSRVIPQRLSIGRDNLVTLSVRSGNSPAHLQIRDGYPLEMQVSRTVLRIVLAANSTADLTYVVHPTHRGEFTWGDIQIRQLGAWKLAWQDWKISQSQVIAVYPDLIGLRALSVQLTLPSSGALRQARQSGMGTEFAELREYTSGDDTRLIDWKATARRHHPLIRVLEPEREQTLIILLDRGRLMTAQVQGLSRFDWGLNATLALALAGLNRGDRVGVAVFDRQIHTWLPPERGQHHLSKLMERLTQIQPVLLESDYLGTVTTLLNQQTRRALIVLITDLVDPIASAELLAALRRLAPRYLPFCVTLRDPEVDRQAHTVTQDISMTYTRAVALDLLTQRQTAFALLKQQGALVLDAPADQISEQLVDRYLQIKSKGLL
jgi:uncharacterized protein (DUF58 family)